MKNKLFNAFVAGFFLVSVLASCNKTEVDTTVYVDSYINSIIDNGVTKYTVMHAAYSFVQLSSVGVKGSGGTSVPLANFSDQGYSFYLDDAAATYTTAVPAADSFTYDVVYLDGGTTVKTNAINGKSLIPAQQLTAVKTASDIVLSWKPVANSEAYKVRIFSEDPVTLKSILIYESDYLVPKDTSTDLSIPFSLVSMSPYLSNNLTFDVSAFIFEQGQDTFQAVSVAKVTGFYGVGV
jgi:hypothetical protein